MFFGNGMDGIKEFSTSDKGSFAEYTARERFPKIFRENCSENYEDILKIIVEDGLNGSRHPGIEMMKKAVEQYKDLSIQEFFNDAPFLLAEFYFYHLLLCRWNYGEKRFDYFASKKDVISEEESLDFTNKLEDLFCQKENLYFEKKRSERKEKIKEWLPRLFSYSLSANTADLSQAVDIQNDTVRTICDETDKCVEFLMKKIFDRGSRIDIICDNSRKELFSDIYLAVFLLEFDFTKKVVLHLKPVPFFVSDATMDDFAKFVFLLTPGNRNSKLTKLLQSKQIEVSTDDFWVEPKYFDELPPKKFEKSDLIILKGDLNYRRLIGDYNSEKKRTLTERNLCRFHNMPVIVFRVLKSDLICGVDPVFEAIAKNADSEYKKSGKWGIIQTNF